MSRDEERKGGTAKMKRGKIHGVISKDARDGEIRGVTWKQGQRRREIKIDGNETRSRTRKETWKSREETKRLDERRRESGKNCEKQEEATRHRKKR